MKRENRDVLMGHRRRGAMLVLLLFLAAMLTAVASLAVDYGHVQLVKTQMQRTADAVARGYITYYINDGQNYAATYGPALYAAANNPVDGNSGVNPTVTVTWGYWNPNSSTFNTQSGNYTAVKVTVTRQASAGNAVKLFWGGIIGFNSIDVHASAVACAIPTSLPFAGLGGVTLTGTAQVDSYYSSAGQYTPATASQNATVSSNQNITLSNSATVDGNASPGIGHSTTIGSGATVTGSTAPLKTALSYPTPVVPSSYYDLGTINYSASGPIQIAGGVYYASGLTISGTGSFSFTGPTTVYVNGPLNLSGNLTADQNLPENLTINVVSNDPVTLNGTSELDAYINAPLSAVTIGGGNAISGGIVGQTLNINNGSLHNDLSGGGASVVMLVQ